ncbi:hypothetical protein [Mumia zhuanghuii]|uniref:hypothetical protein n=1 Tax=Mumia zhuanghuii TaxID=2585211 RepID=UPI003632BA4D
MPSFQPLDESSAWLPLESAPIPEDVDREDLFELRATGPSPIEGAEYVLALASYWHDTRHEVVVDEELRELSDPDMSEELWRFLASDRWAQQDLGTKRFYDPAGGGFVRASATGNRESPSVTLELVAATTADAPEYATDEVSFSRYTYEVVWDGEEWQWLDFAVANSPEVQPSQDGSVKGAGWVRLPPA